MCADEVNARVAWLSPSVFPALFRSRLEDLRERLADLKGHARPPLGDILAKLADAGLELEGLPNAHGVVITDADIPF